MWYDNRSAAQDAAEYEAMAAYARECDAAREEQENTPGFVPFCDDIKYPALPETIREIAWLDAQDAWMRDGEADAQFDNPFGEPSKGLTLPEYLDGMAASFRESANQPVSL